MKNIFNPLFLACVSLLLGSYQSLVFASSSYIPVTGSAWQLAVADVTGDGQNELIYGTYEGAVRCQDLSSGKLLWEVSQPAFLFQIKARDIDFDGHAEVFAVTAEGGLYAISPTGKLLWTFHSPLPLYDVDIGNVEDGGYLEIVTGGIDKQVYVLTSEGQLISQTAVSKVVDRLATGDLDQDGIDEIIVIDNQVVVETLKSQTELIGTWKGVPYPQTLDTWKGTPYPNWPVGLEHLWRKPLNLPKKFGSWHNPYAKFSAFSILIEDVNADGFPEILLGSSYKNEQAVLALTSQGEVLWISKGQPPMQFIGDTYTELFSTAFVQVAELLPTSPGKEVVAVAGGMIRVLNSQGQVVQEANARIGFTDVVMDGQTAYLGSSPNGDNTVYRLEMNLPTWIAQVYRLERQGTARHIGENLAQLRKQVIDYPGTAPKNSRVYDIRLERVKLKPNLSGYEEQLRQAEWLQQQFPYPNLRWVRFMNLVEDTPPLDETGRPWSKRRWNMDKRSGTLTVEEIIQAARWIEVNQVPTVFNIGHDCTPLVTLTTVEKMLQAAPHYLVGFRSAEDDCLEDLSRYFNNYFGPLADLCVKYDKRCITLNKNVWWLAVPTIPLVYDALFSGERGKVLVAATEDSNSRAPELNLLARSGLWLAGVLDHFQVSVISDLFSFSRYHEWEYPKSGHPFLRLLVAHTVMGGSEFSTRILDMKRMGDSYAFSEIGRESSEIFYHLLGKGVVFTPTREQVKGFSSVGILVHTPPYAWLSDAMNGNAPWKGHDSLELQPAVIPHNGSLWGNTETPDDALSRVLFGKRRQFGSHIPATPYGLVAIIPATVPPPPLLAKVPGVTQWWHTDGVSVWQAGRKPMKGQEAAEALRMSFEKAATQLPFRATGEIFLQTVQLEEGKYRLFVIDPGWLDPAERDVSIKIQVGKHVWAKDVLSGESLEVKNRTLRVVVPAGSLRVIDVDTSQEFKAKL